jgi:catechol 2,3-dioxygenase
VNTWARGAPSATEEDARLIDWEIVVPEPADVNAAASNLERSGFEATRDGTDVVARDPWGTALRLISGQ